MLTSCFLYLLIGNVVIRLNIGRFRPIKNLVLKPKTFEPASYPYVSLSIKLWAQRRAGSRNRASRFSPSHGPLRLVTSHSGVTRLSRSPLYEKRSARGRGSPRATKKGERLKIKFTIRYFHIPSFKR